MLTASVRILDHHVFRPHPLRACSRASLGALFLFLHSVPIFAQSQTGVPPAQYTGPGSCSSSSCHGSVQPLSESRVLQNEYSTWIVKDRHARAFEVLTNPFSQRMARILGLGAAEKAPKCLACHALNPPEEQRARTFGPRDGVSCESCHGPASQWLGSHTARGWTHQQSLQAGMYETKDLTRRSEKCLSCHLGTAEKSVDHEMLAAGHPDLYFELDSFSAVMPEHWKEPYDQDPWRGARAWAIGQVVQLREGLRQLERRARTGPWPEYAEMQCYTCHHALTKPEQSWRQQRGYPDRRPGNPPWNASRYAVLRSLARHVNADTAKQLESQVEDVAAQVAKLDSDRNAVAQSASSAAQTTERLLQQLQSRNMDAAFVRRVQKQICADADYIAGQGERAAEQAAIALDSLHIAFSRSTKPESPDQAHAAIQMLFQQVRNPAAYQPAAFSAQLKQLQRLLDAATP